MHSTVSGAPVWRCRGRLEGTWGGAPQSDRIQESASKCHVGGYGSTVPARLGLAAHADIDVPPPAMEFLSQTYIALRGPQGAPQDPSDTIARLTDRLSPATLLADRRAAVLALKGLARDWRADIGERALPGLLEVLQNDAEVDADIGKAVLETLNILCEVHEDAPPQARELSFKHTDRVLANDAPTHKLFALLADQSFYLRLTILQYLVTLLQNRRQVVQGYFLKAPVGPTTVIAILDEKREIIRTGAYISSCTQTIFNTARFSRGLDYASPVTVTKLRHPEDPDFRGCI